MGRLTWLVGRPRKHSSTPRLHSSAWQLVTSGLGSAKRAGVRFQQFIGNGDERTDCKPLFLKPHSTNKTTHAKNLRGRLMLIRLSPSDTRAKLTKTIDQVRYSGQQTTSGISLIDVGKFYSRRLLKIEPMREAWTTLISHLMRARICKTSSAIDAFARNKVYPLRQSVRR